MGVRQVHLIGIFERIHLLRGGMKVSVLRQINTELKLYAPEDISGKIDPIIRDLMFDRGKYKLKDLEKALDELPEGDPAFKDLKAGLKLMLTYIMPIPTV